MQWLYEDGTTPFLRAAQSGDTEHPGIDMSVPITGPVCITAICN